MDLTQATAKELGTLHGVGAKTAHYIIQERDRAQGEGHQFTLEGLVHSTGKPMDFFQQLIQQGEILDIRGARPKPTGPMHTPPQVIRQTTPGSRHSHASSSSQGSQQSQRSVGREHLQEQLRLVKQQAADDARAATQLRVDDAQAATQLRVDDAGAAEQRRVDDVGAAEQRGVDEAWAAQQQRDTDRGLADQQRAMTAQAHEQEVADLRAQLNAERNRRTPTNTPQHQRAQTDQGLGFQRPSGGAMGVDKAGGHVAGQQRGNMQAAVPPTLTQPGAAQDDVSQHSANSSPEESPPHIAPHYQKHVQETQPSKKRVRHRHSTAVADQTGAHQQRGVLGEQQSTRGQGWTQTPIRSNSNPPIQGHPVQEWVQAQDLVQGQGHTETYLVQHPHHARDMHTVHEQTQSVVRNSTPPMLYPSGIYKVDGDELHSPGGMRRHPDQDYIHQMGKSMPTDGVYGKAHKVGKSMPTDPDYSKARQMSPMPPGGVYGHVCPTKEAGRADPIVEPKRVYQPYRARAEMSGGAWHTPPTVTKPEAVSETSEINRDLQRQLEVMTEKVRLQDLERNAQRSLSPLPAQAREARRSPSPTGHRSRSARRRQRTVLSQLKPTSRDRDPGPMDGHYSAHPPQARGHHRSSRPGGGRSTSGQAGHGHHKGQHHPRPLDGGIDGGAHRDEKPHGDHSDSNSAGHGRRHHSKSSSSSSSPHDRHRYRPRSPGMPKMVTFNGRGNWESFIYQFERTAKRCDWRPSRKQERLLDCLVDQALDYTQKRGTIGEYDELREALAQRFMNKDTASVARKQLHTIRQREDESLEEFSQRVHFLAMDGHPEAGESTQQQIAVESFLIGCKEKRAAEVVMEREPKTIYEAQIMVKTNVNNHKALFGTRANTQRQVAFAKDSGEYSREVRNVQSAPQPAETPAKADDTLQGLQADVRAMKQTHETDMKEMKAALNTITTLVKHQAGRPAWTSPQSSGTPPPSPGRRSPGSPRGRLECYHCHEPGHFRYECPKLKALQSAATATAEPSLNP